MPIAWQSIAGSPIGWGVEVSSVGEVAAGLSLSFEMSHGVESEVSFPLDFDLFVLILALQLARGLPDSED